MYLNHSMQIFSLSLFTCFFQLNRFLHLIPKTMREIYKFSTILLKMTQERRNNYSIQSAKFRKFTTFLRVQTVSKKTCEIAHISFNFKLGLKCQNTVIFGIMKDGSFMLNTLNIIICFTCRTSFKMALTTFQKWLT